MTLGNSMRELLEFKDIHKGKDIYVIGSGYSAQFIDPTFFQDKITIGINQVYKRFHVDYLVRKEHLYVKEFYNEYPSGIWFISKHNYGVYDRKQYSQLNNEIPSNICIYEHTNNIYKLSQTELPKDKLITSFSTITTGIHLAAFMGAKTILLVGHDCGTLDGKCNFDGYHTKESLAIAWKKNGEEGYKKWLPVIENDTIQLKKLIKEAYGCDIYSINPFINFNLEGHEYRK